ncbi:MAG: rod shape-determining protein MreD [Zymomonas mobilis subsp. pomaceae]|uniref:Uncharacterized protein n=1 Tax=Zymomonas mobilis subsp. pomaceae (strain ATCC 29192 / DSM 22645 / JCM 10191 / CCUG 17912 / NBRC 13757 / NCIMB 11200 / NRRL B-4491 / Barker I) TaxID=579138 RepID=F8ESG5_ZYMMT|nr:rod shape-determining protein MreD [Zymomonas mobilis]AEI37740.1 hypothetical protein Zymop_0840 [Zymomonas mobilis subsp. pomaceae ATCC 29192]MDX5949107.1 rod shape-determining protein MreD [Zymomonas mobilis subsp. pomaceae]GEB88914.1 hypothetical protein ZMO02_05510 [Zymomonas mobilis subsp. pomaceae]
MIPLIEKDQTLSWLPIKAQITPLIMVLFASLLETGPLVSVLPLLPSFGLLVALGWRLLRPELWQAWIALPLGMSNDLINGQPLGISMISWTICFLAFDIIDNRLVWRNYWQDWIFASCAIIFCTLFSLFMTSWIIKGHTILLILSIMPEILISILLFPLVEALCAIVDRWRLAV